MRPGFKTLVGATLVAPGLLFLTLSRQASYGDEPSRLGRLFRFGGGGGNSAPATPAQPSPVLGETVAEPPAEVYAPASGSVPPPRIVPQPRHSRPATEADPILSRITLARSNDGNQFGMFLEVFADGTVIDGEGVHHLSMADLRPLNEALQSSELYRLKGHCGAPATDFVEQVHIVVYERSLGRLRANAFSYSGNPQGCDHAVRHLHNALEAMQGKLTRTSSAATATAAPVSAPPIPTTGTGVTIPLSPTN